MTRELGIGDFEYVPDVDPGDRLAYYVYKATAPDSYEVNAGRTPAPRIYLVFGLASQDWDFSDAIILDGGVTGTFETGAGNDTFSIQYNLWPVRLFGGSGDDLINPLTSGFDPGALYDLEAYGGAGNDTINGGDSNDTLYGDTADSFTGNPVIASVTLAPYNTQGDGDDRINGYGGSDMLDGGAGDDFLYGGPRGHGDLDILTGGAGSDAFMLSYRDGGADSGTSFWSGYFDSAAKSFASTAVGDLVQNIADKTTEDIANGIIGASLGAAGGVLAGTFVNLVEALIASATPTSTNQDAMVVTDFDPRQDVLMLPLQQTVTQSLTTRVSTEIQVPGVDTTGNVLEFSAGGKVYAYILLSADFLDAMEIDGASDDASQILNNVVNLGSALQSVNGTVGFTNLASTTISDALPGGGFQPQKANLPPGSAVKVFGAIGGLVVSNGDSDTFGHILAGTDYTDILSTNAQVTGFAQLTLTTTAARIHGFGGSDVIYGTASADTLHGDDGNDFLYSFVSTEDSNQKVDKENLFGGAGDDILYGGASAGNFDGGSGNDTFAVVYLSNYADPLQLEVDLTAGYAAERAAPADTTAPVSSKAPFPGSSTDQDQVPNNYKLTGVENAIGGPLNDWIKAASGSRIEGGPGADYLNVEAGGATLSYEGSTDGVSAQIFKYHAVLSGGDAAGDVVGMTSAQNIVELIGSSHDDILGAFDDNGRGGMFTIEGGGGNDVFQILGVSAYPSDYFIADFTKSATEHDLIDVSGLGITSFEQILALTDTSYVVYTGRALASPYMFIFLENDPGRLDASDFVLASEKVGPVHDDAYIVREGQTLTAGAAASVLVNDDGFSTASLLRNADHGTVELLADGSFRYTPDAGYFGIDSFTYQAATSNTQADGQALFYVFPTFGRTIDLLALTPEQQIAATYAAFLGRAADAAGYAYWLAELEAGPERGALKSIAGSFAVSNEAEALYPLLADPAEASDAAIGAFIDAVYGNLFNRSFDDEGLAYWTTRTKQTIAAGTDVGNVIVDIISGTAVGSDAQALLGKVAVGVEFLEQQALYQTQWQADTDVQAATALLRGVDDDPQTVLFGIKQADQLIAAHA